MPISNSATVGSDSGPAGLDVVLGAAGVDDSAAPGSEVAVAGESVVGSAVVALVAESARLGDLGLTASEGVAVAVAVRPACHHDQGER